MADTGLPPFSGDDTTCAKCGHKGAFSRYRAYGQCLHDATDDILGYELHERLHRQCTRCDYAWDEAVVSA